MTTQERHLRAVAAVGNPGRIIEDADADPVNRPGVVGGFILCEEDGEDGKTEVVSR